MQRGPHVDTGCLSPDAPLNIRARHETLPGFTPVSARLKHRHGATNLDGPAWSALGVEMVSVQGVALNANVRIHRVEGPRQHRGDNLGAGDHRGAIIHRIGERATHCEGDVCATLLPLNGPALHQARGAERRDELHASILNRPVHDNGPVLSVRQRNDTTQPKMARGDLRRSALVVRRGIRLGIESCGPCFRDLSGGVGVTEAHGTDATLAEVRAEAPSRTGYGPADVTGDEKRTSDGGQRWRRGRRGARGSGRG